MVLSSFYNAKSLDYHLQGVYPPIIFSDSVFTIIKVSEIVSHFSWNFNEQNLFYLALYNLSENKILRFNILCNSYSSLIVRWAESITFKQIKSFKSTDISSIFLIDCLNISAHFSKVVVQNYWTILCYSYLITLLMIFPVILSKMP